MPGPAITVPGANNPFSAREIEGRSGIVRCQRKDGMVLQAVPGPAPSLTALMFIKAVLTSCFDRTHHIWLRSNTASLWRRA